MNGLSTWPTTVVGRRLPRPTPPSVNSPPSWEVRRLFVRHQANNPARLRELRSVDMIVFVSHIHEAASIEQVIKNVIETSLGEQLKVFCSRDSKVVSVSVNWLDKHRIRMGE